jgi:hypothetical protein
MQTLEKRDTYTPPNASQVRGNCDPALNREETLSVLGLKTSSNPPMGTNWFRMFQTTIPAVTVYKNIPLLTTNTIAGSLILHLLTQTQGV